MPAPLASVAAASSSTNPPSGTADLTRGARRATFAFLAALGLACAALAVLVPYHATDAFVYGVWSKRIAQTGGFWFDTVGAGAYQRPLFYVTQGWLWRVFGSHEEIGRVLSLAFTATLVVCVGAFARRERWGGPTAGALAAVLLVTLPDFVQQAMAGQTDGPAAALVALAGWLALADAPEAGGGRRWAAVAFAAAAAALTKTTVLPALGGLGLATLIGPRPQVRDRLVWRTAPIAVGVVVGLVYDFVQAQHLHQGLYAFITGTPGVAALANQVRYFSGDAARTQAAQHVQALGPYISVPLLFALVYAPLRVVGAAHRAAVAVAVVVAAIALGLSSVLTGVLPGATVALVGTAGPAATVISVLWLVPLALSAGAPVEAVASRLALARLLAWGLPPLGAWLVAGIVTDTRTLAPSWPALVLLMAVVLHAGVRACERHGRVAAAAPLALILAAGALNLRNLDGLGAATDGSIDSTRAIRALASGDALDRHHALRAADPQLGGMVAALEPVAGARGRVLTDDGRMTYFFVDRTTVRLPTACRELARFRAMAFVTNGERLVKRPVPQFRPSFWTRCASPRVRLVAGVPGSFQVYAISAG